MKRDLVFEAPRRGLPPRHLADLDAVGRAAAVAELGLPPFRAKAARAAVLRPAAGRPAPDDRPARRVRDKVADALFPQLITAVRDIECDAGETRKTLWRAHDGTTFESVLMRYPNRNTVCISSQAGCGMACPFCATGQAGLTRNLSTAEILEQVRAAAVTLRDEFGDRPPMSCSWAWGAAGELRPGGRRGATHHRRTARGSGSRPVGDGLHGRAGAGHPQAGRRTPRVTLAVSLHTPTTNCATPWCR